MSLNVCIAAVARSDMDSDTLLFDRYQFSDMKDSQIIEYLEKIVEESGTHEMDHPFIDHHVYDGNVDYIFTAIREAVKYAYVAGQENEDINEFWERLHYKSENK